MTVLLIALGHGLFVWFVSAITKSRFWTAIAASAAIVIGVFTGQPTYLLVDVAAVLITLSVCWPKKKIANKPEAPPPSKATENSQGSGDGWWSILGVLGACAFLAAKFYNTPTRPITAPAPQSTVNTQAAALSHASTPARSERPKPKTSRPKQTQPPTVESCLKLRSDDAMVRCLEKAP